MFVQIYKVFFFESRWKLCRWVVWMRPEVCQSTAKWDIRHRFLDEISIWVLSLSFKLAVGCSHLTYYFKSINQTLEFCFYGHRSRWFILPFLVFLTVDEQVWDSASLPRQFLVDFVSKRYLQLLVGQIMQIAVLLLSGRMMVWGKEGIQNTESMADRL